MTICIYLITSALKVDIKLFLGQGIFIRKIIAENETF